MKGFKKIAALALAVIMIGSALTGCAKLDENAVIVEVGEDKVDAGFANFYARFSQTQYEAYASMLGQDMWTQKGEDGKTREETVKAAILTEIETLYVLEDHAEEYNVALTDEEKAAITEVAEAFLKDNKENVRDAISANQENAERFMTLFTIRARMYEAMTADVDTKVADDEAAQKKMQYVGFAFTNTAEDGTINELTDEEKAELKKEAEQYLEEAKEADDFAKFTEEKEYELKEAAFDAESTMVSEEVIKAADTLKEGEFASLIETDKGYYVVKLVSEFDREATEAKKATIVSERKQAKVKELEEAWLKEAKIKEHKSVWEKISFADLGVTLKQQEQ